MKKVFFRALSFLVLALTAALFTAAQTSPAQTAPAQSQQPVQTPASDEVPVVDGGSGACSIDFNVTDSAGKPVYAARIDMHLAYGFAGAHKLDLGVYTNAQGKARFTGLPLKVRKPPIEFRAKKDDLIGLATMDPMAECQAKHDIVLDKEKPPAQ